MGRVGMYFQVTNLNGIKLDYAFADYGRLNDVQYVSVSVTY
jgi:hypothetical protein